MDQLLHRIALRVSTEDYTRLKHTAKASNLTVSKYVRLLIQQAIYNDKND